MYLVTAYRWGWINAHQYPVYCGADHTKAVALARAENATRGGKYGCAVYEWDADGTEAKLTEYFGSSMSEEHKPFHNWRICYFERLGNLLDRYADGKMWLPVGDGTVKLTAVPPPPDFVLEQIKHERDLTDRLIEMENEAQSRDKA